MQIPDDFAKAWRNAAIKATGVVWHDRNLGTQANRVCRDQYVLLVAVGARMHLDYAGRSLVLRPGDRCLLPPNFAFRQRHFEVLEDYGGVLICDFWMMPMGTASDPLRLLALPAVVPARQPERLHEQCRELLASCAVYHPKAAQSGGWRLRPLLELLLVDVLLDGFAEGLRCAVSMEAPPEWLTNLRLWLDESWRDPSVTIAAMARHCGYSPSHVAHCFRHHFAMTPLQYLRSERLLVAARLLRSQPHQPIAAIMARCGYRDRGRFARDFRRRYGCSPRDWRRACGS